MMGLSRRHMNEDEFGNVSRDLSKKHRCGHVTQVKPPAVGLPPALRRHRFFFSSATRSDSKFCTKAIALHDDLSQVPLDRHCMPCISSAAHHGSMCHI